MVQSLQSRPSPVHFSPHLARVIGDLLGACALREPALHHFVAQFDDLSTDHTLKRSANLSWKAAE